MTVDVSALGATEWKDLDVRKLLLFTSLATVFENALMYPWWAMKTRAQVQTGALTSGLNLKRMGGLRSLYKGFAFYSVAALPAYLVYLSAYTYSKSALGLHYGDEAKGGQSSGSSSGAFTQFMAPLAAGIIADAACLGLYTPVEIVAQRLQLPTRYRSAREVIVELWRHGGWRGFFTGFGATIVTSAVASGVWWMAYENLKKAFTAAMLPAGLPVETARARPTPSPPRRTTSKQDPAAGRPLLTMGLRGLVDRDRLQEQARDVLATVRQSLPHMAAGFVAGGTAALVCNPMDVVKTRMQTQHGKPPGAFFQGLGDLVRQEGLRRSFMRGVLPKIASTAPLGMISSIMYEGILYLSRRDDKGKQDKAT